MHNSENKENPSNDIETQKTEKIKNELLNNLGNNISVLIRGISEKGIETIIDLFKKSDKKFEVIDIEKIVNLDTKNSENYNYILSLSKKNVIIYNIDLLNTFQDKKLAFFRTEKQANDSLTQILITKPGTIRYIPSNHSCYNWPMPI